MGNPKLGLNAQKGEKRNRQQKEKVVCGREEVLRRVGNPLPAERRKAPNGAGTTSYVAKRKMEGCGWEIPPVGGNRSP